MSAKERKYKVNYAMVKRMAEAGLTQRQMAQVLNIPVDTFLIYIKKDENLRTAIDEGNASPNRLVEQALFQRALGYEFDEIQTQGKSKRITRKHIAPDVKAMEFWLTNREKGKWKKTNHVSLTGSLTLRDRALLGNQAQPKEKK